jgi:glycosyltransferase involved in cell wall biosynthesis
MKLLVITYSYPPDLTPRAFRWSAIAAQLARRGHQMDVLCAAVADRAAGGDPAGLAVHRVRDSLLNASARVTPGASAPAMRAGALAAVRSAPRLAARALWRAVYWPDYACGWIVPAARAARRLCERNAYDWIISVSHPFTGHVVGLRAKRHLSGARWLVDVGDPFHLMKEPALNNRLLYSGLNRAIEQRVVSRADAVSVTTDEAKRLYETHFEVAAPRISVIPPLISLPGTAQPRARADGTVRLVYVGTLYRRLRSPERLLALTRALAAASRRAIELHFYGSVNDCGPLLAPWLEAGPARIYAHGLVSRASVNQAMADADVLVNIGNASAAQLASKVVEYMAMGKPVLNLAGPDRDASVAALAGYPASCTVAAAEDAASPAVVSRVLEFVARAQPVDPAVTAAVRARYGEDRIAARYAALLEARP